MTRPEFGRLIPCRRCAMTGLLARNGRPASDELVRAIRSRHVVGGQVFERGRHPREVSAEPETITVPALAGLFGRSDPLERIVKRCRSCEGEGFLEQSARAGVG